MKCRALKEISNYIIIPKKCKTYRRNHCRAFTAIKFPWDFWIKIISSKNS